MSRPDRKELILRVHQEDPMNGDIIDRIDAATGCQQCEGPLGESPSDLYCSESCQDTWQSHRVGVQRVVIQRIELTEDQRRIIVQHLEAMSHAAQEMGQVLIRQVRLAVKSAEEAFQQLRPLFPAAHEGRRDLMQVALDARRNRNTGPPRSGRAPRRIDPRRTR